MQNVSFVSSKHHEQHILFCTTVKSILYCNLCGLHKSMKHSFSDHASDANIPNFRHLLLGVWKLCPNSRNASNQLRTYVDQSEIISRARFLVLMCCPLHVYSPHARTRGICTNLQRPLTSSTYFVISERC